jgi:hypothetical protein
MQFNMSGFLVTEVSVAVWVCVCVRLSNPQQIQILNQKKNLNKEKQIRKTRQ